MKTWLKQLILLYLVIVILKIGLSLFILAPSAFSDDYGFAKIARSVFYHGEFTVHGELVSKPPFYPITLSLAYLFKDMTLVYFFMKVINSLVSSLIIFPAWLLSREFFNQKRSMLITILIAVLPSHFAFSFFIMSENLFYPLFLLSSYLIYKSFTEKNYQWDVLAGIAIGLTYLTKINAIILPALVGIVFLIMLFKKEYLEVKKKLIMALFFLITISPWLIRNGLLYGFGLKLFVGGYAASAEHTVSTVMAGQNFLTFISWSALYLSYVMVATCFIFFILNFITISNMRDKNTFILSIVTITSTLLALFLSSSRFNIGSTHIQTIIPWLTGDRIIGRYLDFTIPLILINGVIGLKYLYNKKKLFLTMIFVSCCLSILASQLIYFQLFPINNMSLSWLGVSKFIFDFLFYKTKTFESIFSYESTVLFTIFLISVVILFALLFKKNKLYAKPLLYFFIVFFSLINLLNFSIIYYNTNTFWYNGEQTQLGLWFNKYDPGISTILFDERDGCKIFKTDQTCIYNPFRRGGSATIMGFWMNDEIKVGSVDNLKGVDYVVSRHELDLQLLKETKNGIFLYKVNKED